MKNTPFINIPKPGLENELFTIKANPAKII